MMGGRPPPALSGCMAMQIIVVDPSRTVLKIVGQLLESAGHRVYPFADGTDALDCLQKNQDIDALFTSIELPTMSGIDLCRKARSLSCAHRPIYIVVMSSSREQEKLVSALEGGADDYIGKPPAMEELLARIRAAERFNVMQRDLARLATTDPLTGLLNRRAFFERAEAACVRARPGSQLTAIILDIDHFKQINDTIGDQVIRMVADEMRRLGTLAGRLGGEEFVLLLEGTALPNAIELAQQLRVSIAALEIKIEGEIMKFSCSFGVDEWEFGDTIDDLLRRADTALYEAKNSGRDRVVAYDSRNAGRRIVKGTGIVRVGDR
jgi:two-component system, cell cycle response regulator